MRKHRKKGKLLAAGRASKNSAEMCDYSLHNVKSRPAKIGDTLTARKRKTIHRPRPGDRRRAK